MADKHDAQNGTESQAPKQATCYNCGAYDHYMMSCPEPTRQIPAGLAAARAAGLAAQPGQAAQSNAYGQQRYDNRPFKRQKTAPVITKYPNFVAPPVVTRYHPQGPQNPSTQYGQSIPPYQQQQYPQQTPGYSPYNNAYGQQYEIYGQPPFNQGYGQYSYPPGPPHSAPSTIQTGYYQQNEQYVPHGQVPQHGQYPQTGQYPEQRPYYPQHHGGPYPQHNPRQPPYNQAHQPSPGQLQRQSSIPNLNHHQNSHPSPQQAKQWSPTNQQDSIPIKQHKQQTHQHTASTLNALAQASPSDTSSQPFPTKQRSTSVTSSNHASQTQSEQTTSKPALPDEDELYEWDLTNAFREIPSISATPMAYPLGNVFHQEKIPPPPTGQTGLTSRYVRMASVETWTKHITESLHWQNLQKDPAFKSIDWEAPQVSIQEMRDWILQQRFVVTKDEGSEKESPIVAKEEKLPNLDSVNRRKRSRTADIEQDADEQLEKNTIPEDIKSPPQESQSSLRVIRDSTPTLDVSDDPWAPQPGEAILSTDPADQTDAIVASSELIGSPKSRPIPAPLVPASNISIMTSASDCPVAGGLRRNEGLHHNQNSTPRDQHNVWPNHTIPPPPPPPPAHLRPQVGGVLDSPISEGSVSRPTWDFDHAEDNFPEPGSSPLSPTSAELLGQITQSVGGKPESRRQHDDVTARAKRRQPTVASAYSRRW